MMYEKATEAPYLEFRPAPCFPRRELELRGKMAPQTKRDRAMLSSCQQAKSCFGRLPGNGGTSNSNACSADRRGDNPTVSIIM